MERIKFYSRILRLIAMFAIIPATVISFLLKWYGRTIPIYDTPIGFDKKLASSILYYFDYNFQAPLLARITGSLIDGISYFLFIIGCIYFIQLLARYQKGEIFSETVFNLYKKITRIAFIIVLYAPLKLPFLSALTTYFHNAPGKRIISTSISSYDFINIFLLGCLLIITSIMHRGYVLKKEDELTV